MAPKIKHGDAPCEVCGKVFRRRTAASRLCSLACRDHLRRGAGFDVTCETCSTTFKVRTKYYAEGPHKRLYCSNACRQIGHRVLPTQERIENRFWANVDKRGEDECWPWKLRPGNNGYGLITFYGYKKTAHRVSYELHHGELPTLDGPHGACVLHSCDNRLCVNPKHLFVGTQGDNMRDMWSKGRGKAPNHSARRSPDPSQT